MNSIGIFGGTFDPIHFGHLRCLVEVLQSCDFTKLHLVPCAAPPHRQQPLADAKHRLNMCRLATANNTTLDKLVVDDCELQRQYAPDAPPSYTIDTINEFKERFPKEPLVLILGMDAFHQLPRWHRWQELTEQVKLVVLHRPNYQEQPFDAALQPILAQQVDSFAKLRQTANAKVLFKAVTALDISATLIRQQIAQGLRPSFLLPEPVISYIEQHHLYATPEENL